MKIIVLNIKKPVTDRASGVEGHIANILFTGGIRCDFCVCNWIDLENHVLELKTDK